MVTKIKLKNTSEKLKGWGLLFLVTCYLLPVTCLYGYSALDSWQWGEPQRGLSARSLALGSAGISSTLDASSLIVNPALMDLGESRGLFSVTGGPLWFFDKRDHSYVGTNYVTTDNLYFQFPSASLLWAASKKNDIVLGFGFFSDLNFDYHLEEKNSSALTTDRVDVEGGFHNWVLGANWKAAPWFSMGLSYLWGTGKREMDLYLSTTTTTGTLISKTSDYLDLSGNTAVLGFDFSYEDLVNVGMYWRSGFDMKVKEKSCSIRNNTVISTASAEYVREFPYQMGAGITYYFDDDFDSKLIFDMIYSAWSGSKYWQTKSNGASLPKTKIDPVFGSVTEYHLGFEHTPFERTFLRYGFSYIPDYSIGSDAQTSVSLGIGMFVQQVVVDIGAEYSFRDVSQKRISQIYSGFDSIMERRQRILVTVGYRW